MTAVKKVNDSCQMTLVPRKLSVKGLFRSKSQTSNRYPDRQTDPIRVRSPQGFRPLGITNYFFLTASSTWTDLKASSGQSHRAKSLPMFRTCREKNYWIYSRPESEIGEDSDIADQFFFICELDLSRPLSVIVNVSIQWQTVLFGPRNKYYVFRDISLTTGGGGV